MSRPIPNTVRSTVLTAFRYHCTGSPATNAQVLTEVAITEGFSPPRAPPPGSTVQSWATRSKAPLWAVRAAAIWLQRNAQLSGAEERAAVTAVLSDLSRE